MKVQVVETSTRNVIVTLESDFYEEISWFYNTKVAQIIEVGGDKVGDTFKDTDGALVTKFSIDCELRIHPK